MEVFAEIPCDRGGVFAGPAVAVVVIAASLQNLRRFKVLAPNGIRRKVLYFRRRTASP